MIRLIKEMRDSRAMHLVVCSHLLKDVEDSCEEVVILRNGELVNYSNLEEERRSNRRFLEMEAVGANEEFVEAIEGLGCECAMTGDRRIKIVLADSIEVRDIYRLAAEREIQIRRLSYRRDSLEDIFLKAMDSVPVVKPEQSEHRNATMLAISATVPSRPDGMPLVSSRQRFSSPSSFAARAFQRATCRSVSIAPGLIPTTRTP